MYFSILRQYLGGSVRAFAVVFLTLSIGCESATDQLATLSGVVRDADDPQVRLGNVRVSIRRVGGNDGETLFTDSQGAYEAREELVAGAQYQIVFSLAEYQEKQINETLNAGPNILDENLHKVSQINTCTNGQQDASEDGVDCGGACSNACAVDTCTNNQQDANEDGVDCGGACSTACAVDTCTNNQQDPNEDGVDCGGACSTACAVDTCTNNQQDANEDGVDCGGACSTACAVDTCANNQQDANEDGVDCGGACSTACAVDTCTNNQQDPNEDGIDCGGACSTACAVDTCTNNQQDPNEDGIDCGGACSSACAVDTCTNNQQDPNEDGIDCGGACSTACAVDTCTNNQQDANEEGVDCGGVCSAACGCTPDTCAVPANLVVELGNAKTLNLTWNQTDRTTYYRLLESLDGGTTFSQVGNNFEPTVTQYAHQFKSILIHYSAQYMVESCNDLGCVSSNIVVLSNTFASAIEYFKSENPSFYGAYGRSVSLSNDGRTLAVGAALEDITHENSGAAYIYTRSNNNRWTVQATLAPDDNQPGDTLLGGSLDLSSDGNTLVVGASDEDSSTRGSVRNNLVRGSGAAYVFIRNTTGTWSQQNFLKASNIDENDAFGRSVSISGDGFTLAIAAPREESNAITINGDQQNNDSSFAGAVYVFVSRNGNWQQQAYIKAPVPVRGFGIELDLSDDGNTLVASGSIINGGNASWIFVRENNRWSVQTQLQEGSSVSLSGDGQVVAIGASNEGSNSTGVNGAQNNQLAPGSGAVYIYDRNGNTWEQQAYIKASNTDSNDRFAAVSLSRDGLRLAVGAMGEDSFSVGVGGDQSNSNAGSNSGAVYIFDRSGNDWQQQFYLKASNTTANHGWGRVLSLSGDGQNLAIGNDGESGAGAGIDADQSITDNEVTGAVYVY